MKSSRLFFLLLLACIRAYSQNGDDSLCERNKALIAELKNRINLIGIETTDDCATRSKLLKAELKKQSDSIVVLNQMLRAYEKKRSNNFSNIDNDVNKKNMIASQLPECDCFRLFFDPYQTELNYATIGKVDSLVKEYFSKPDLKIRLIGFADKTGDESHNIVLSKQRVTNLKSYLVKVKNVPEKNIEIDWHGSSKSYEGGDVRHFLNRRLEFYLE